MPPKRRRKYHGLYYHSSPPKVFSMNGTSSSSKTSGRDETKEAFVVKPSNIRIWIHDKDVGKLTRVLWAGHGNRLRTETSTNPRVKKFIETVPYVLNVIKDVHQAVVDNNLDLLKSKIEPPVPPSLITTKDANGLTVMHKAAGLAHTQIVEYLIKIWPGGATDMDATGKTPLHWAASAKNNTRCYNLLVQAGADEEALDYRMKTASYYKNKPHDIDRSLLTVVPDAPRVPQEAQPDWSALVDEVGQLSGSQSDLLNNNKKIENELTGNGFNLLTSRSKANTIEDTSEPGDGIEDGETNLTIEEQAVKDAIEDEQAFEEEQNERAEKQQPDENNDDNNGDENGNDDDYQTVTPPPTTDAAEKTNELWTAGENEAENNDESNGVGFEKSDEDGVNANNEAKIDGNVMESTTPGSKNEEVNTNDSGPSKQGENLAENKDEEKPAIQHQESDKIDDTKEEIVEKTDVEKKLVEEKKDVEEKKEADRSIATEEKSENEIIDKSTESEDEKKSIENIENNNKTEKDEEDKEISENCKNSNEAEADEGEESNTPGETHDDHQIRNDSPEIDNNSPNDVAVENEVNPKLSKPSSAHSVKSETIQKMANGGESSSEKLDEAVQNAINSTETKSPQRLLSNGDANELNAIPGDSIRPKTPRTASAKNARNGSSNSNRTEDGKKSPKDDDDEDEKVEEHSQDSYTLNGITDENHNAITSNGARSITPPSPALEYEGVVQGEPDDNQVQSQSGGYFANETDRIQSIIDSGDMEQLAALVLNGEGKKLLGARSKQPEIQAFLDNVPSYMNKIRRVHKAARDGNIRDLQAALDRRKFAIAKDEISPDGATPLHVATIFGHAGIIRYLGGRFPETTSAVDDNGRTALHYAATVNDNGHFYNLLMNQGSNPKSLDKLGNSAEFYRDNRGRSMDVFSYRKLLQAFGADENLEDEMLSDQDKTTNQNRVEIPLFRTEQGRYLAEGKCATPEPNPIDFQYELTAALGDPLIKGLTEVAEKRPADPILYLANYLHNFAKNNANRPMTTTTSATVPPQQMRQGTAHSVAGGHLGQLTSAFINNSNAPPPSSYNQAPSEPTDEPASSPELDDSSSSLDDRDEHGQSMLHFACARPHSRNALFNLIEESDVNITYRDELYRTARDVSLQANQPANAKQIDNYVLSLAAKGNFAAFENMALEGYDHILDITDDEGTNIIDFARGRGHNDLANYLDSIPQFEEHREDLHHAIRENKTERAKSIISGADANRIIRAKNYYGRTALHIAVLKENEALVDFFTDVHRASLKVGDNLERTALHYAMGINSVEKISRILIRKGAKRIVKDLKGRQPSYYFMNKADVLRLQEEEDEDHGIE